MIKSGGPIISKAPREGTRPTAGEQVPHFGGPRAHSAAPTCNSRPSGGAPVFAAFTFYVLCFPPILWLRLTFPFYLYGLAFISAALTSLVSLPLWRRFCLKTGLVDDPGHRKIHDKRIPLAGGLAVLSGLLLPTLIACLMVWLASGGTSFDEPSLQPRPQSHALLKIPVLRPGAAFLLRHGLDVRIGQLASI